LGKAEEVVEGFKQGAEMMQRIAGPRQSSHSNRDEWTIRYRRTRGRTGKFSRMGAAAREDIF
jgi:hypothetical protein